MIASFFLFFLSSIFLSLNSSPPSSSQYHLPHLLSLPFTSFFCQWYPSSWSSKSPALTSVLDPQFWCSPTGPCPPLPLLQLSLNLIKLNIVWNSICLFNPPLPCGLNKLRLIFRELVSLFALGTVKIGWLRLTNVDTCEDDHSIKSAPYWEEKMKLETWTPQPHLSPSRFLWPMTGLWLWAIWSFAIITF